MLRGHGARKRYYHDEVGINSRLDALQAAVLLVKLGHLDGWSEGRRRNAAIYSKRLAGIEQVRTPVEREGCRHIYNQYVIRAEDRDGLRDALRAADIGCEIYYPLPLHLQKCFSSLGHSKGDFPEAERAAAETLALPVYPEMTGEMIDHVTAAIERFYS